MSRASSSPATKTGFLGLVGQAGSLAAEVEKTLEAETEPDAKALRYTAKIRESAQALHNYAEAEVADGGFDPRTSPPPAECREVRHELRNRLNHLSGPSQLLRRQLKAAKWKPTLEKLQETLETCLDQVDHYGATEAGYLPTLDPSVRSDPESEAELEPRLHRTPVEPASILVADDEPEIREFLADVLGESGHEVSVATDGEEALRMVEAGDFDLVLLDLGLPKLSGFRVLERLEASGQLHHLPVIVVTGRRKVQDAVRCIEYGADDFLSKPVRIELLHARVNSCLERKRLREAEFQQFFPPQLARQFARHPDLRDLEGKFAEVSLLFCDIRGFSSISERLGPRETVGWLRGVMSELSGCVIDNGGVLVDYAGDELMAMWGAPTEVPDHAERACVTALEMLTRIPALNQTWSGIIGAETNFGIGINTGKALVGNIGTDRKFKYGPLGNAVNLASRVQGVTKKLKTNLLITEATRKALPSSSFAGRIRRICKVRVVNIDEPVELYEITDRCGDDWDLLRDKYEEALSSFEEGKVTEAIALLGNVLALHPADGPTFQLLNRIAAARTSPDTAVDAVWTLVNK